MAKKQSKAKISYKTKHKKVVNSHDAFFKSTFAHKDVAQSYIEKFMEQRLVQNIDFQSLTLESTSYITADLEEYFADLVWSAAYKDTQIKIAFLFEHKSFVPPYPDVQLMRYITEHLEKQIKAKEKLNVVIPIIIYHGKEEWEVRPFHTYFEGIDEVLKKYIPSFAYQFTNLGHYTDEELINMGIGKLLNVFLAMMHIRDLQYIRNNFETIFVYAEQYLPQNEHFFQTIFVYLFKNIELSGSEMEKVVRTIQSPVKNFAMSTYDLLIEKGKKEGKKEGKIESDTIKNRDFTTSLVLSTDFDNEKIATLVGVTIDYVTTLRQELSEK